MRGFKRGSILTALLGLAGALAAGQARAAFVIDSVTLAGPPTLLCGGASKLYTFTVKGSGAGKIIGTSLLWSVYEQDPVFDDLLVDETRFVVTDDANGNFTFTDQFELRCTEDCHLKGKDGQDDEVSRPGNVFVLIEHSITGTNAGMSNILPVSCVVPEPSAWLLATIGMGGLTGLVARRRRVAVED